MKRLFFIGVFVWIISSVAFAQGGGPNCLVAKLNPVTLPFSSTIETTCGMIDDYNASNIGDYCTPGQGKFMAGSDKLYSFTAPLNGSMLIYLESGNVADSLFSIFAFEGCPDSIPTHCIGSDTVHSYIKNLGIIVEAGKSYYIVVDQAISPTNDSCMLQYTIQIGTVNPFCSQFLPNTSNNVPNLDFERGNFIRWSGFTGGCCNISTPNVGFNPAQHSVTSGNATDPYSGGRIPVVAPGGGRYSAMLGNSNTGAQAERLTYKYRVTSRSTCLLYKYAVVLQDPGHEPAAQPRFEINVSDKNGNIIKCGTYKVTAGAGIPCFKVSPTAGDVLYKEWTTVGVDVSAYIGQDITVDYATGDCAYGGHFGYAYLDVSAVRLQITTIGDFCSGPDSVILVAPPGFSSYSWSTGHTDQTIKVPVHKGDSFTVNVTSLQDNSCITPLTIYFDSTATVNADFSDLGTYCQADTVYFNDLSFATGKNADIAYWHWDFGNGDTSSERNPAYIYANSGTFPVKLIVTSTLGCRDSVTKNITILKTLEKPSGTCGITTVNDITFQWTAIPSALGYQISTDNALSWIMPSSGNLGTSHTITGLNPDTTISVLLRALSPNPCHYSFPDTLTCSTLPCPSYSLNISLGDSVIKRGESTTIEANVGGYPGPFQYTWTPNIGSGKGPFTIKPDSSTTYIVKVSIPGITGCQSISDTISIQVDCPDFSGGINVQDTIIVIGNSFTFEANVNGGIGPFQYIWDPPLPNSRGSFTIQPDTPVTYTVLINDLGSKNCMPLNDTLHIDVKCPSLKLHVQASDTNIYIGNSIVIKALANGGSGNYDYQWNPALGTGPGPFTVVPDSGAIYKVIVRDGNAGSCPSLSDSVLIKAFKDCLFYYYLPDAFSPNQDTIHDAFIGIGDCIASFSMQIFDRWGKVLFKTTDYKEGWNGGINNDLQQQMPIGVYPYFAIVTDLHGRSHRFSGLVRLTR